MALVGYPALCEGALGLVGKLFAAGATDGIRSLSGYLLRFMPQEKQQYANLIPHICILLAGLCCNYTICLSYLQHDRFSRK